MRLLRPVFISGFLLASSCGHSTSVFQSAVMKRAPFDLSCDGQAVHIEDLGNDTFGVTGCEKKATYVCLCGFHAFGKCTKPLCEMDAVSQRQ